MKARHVAALVAVCYLAGTRHGRGFAGSVLISAGAAILPPVEMPPGSEDRIRAFMQAAMRSDGVDPFGGKPCPL